MNETIRNYLWWMAAIGILIVPPILVRTSQAAELSRIFAYFVLTGALLALCLYLGLKKGSIIDNLPIARNLKTDQSKKIATYFFRGLPLVIAIVVFAVMVKLIPSVVSYAFNPSSTTVEVHKITHIDSAAMPGAFYIRMGIQTDDNMHLEFWYPDQVLQTNNKYSFTLLPKSDFVLKAEPVE